MGCEDWSKSYIIIMAVSNNNNTSMTDCIGSARKDRAENPTLQKTHSQEEGSSKVMKSVLLAVTISPTTEKNPALAPKHGVAVAMGCCCHAYIIS